MDYLLVYTKRAQKDIKKLDGVVRAKVYKSMREIVRNPFAKTKKLVNFEVGEYRYRIGDYRVIFDIDGSNIVVLRVGHRKDIYK